jgi:hypothetical protein
MRIKKILPDWLIGILLTLFFLFITLTGVLDFPGAIEMKAFDLRARLAAPEDRNPDIELVVIPGRETLSPRGSATSLWQGPR